MISSRAIMFLAFVALLSIVILCDNTSEAILCVGLLTNFLVIVSLLSKWNKVSPGYIPGDGFESDEAETMWRSHTNPLNPPAEHLESSPTSSRGESLSASPAGILQANSAGYDKLDGVPASTGSEYGPRHDEFDTLRQNHLNLDPVAKYPAELFSAGDADAQFAQAMISRNRAKRAIDDRITRDPSWYAYLYDGELQYNENRHWLSQYEY